MERMRVREDEYVALNRESMDKESRKAYRAKEKKKLCVIIWCFTGFKKISSFVG